MLKKIFLIFIIIIFVIVGYNALINFSVASLNYYKNNTYKNYNDVEKRAGIAGREFKNYHDWLWQGDRSFTFDVIYMNLFSPGKVKFRIKEDKRISAFVIEAQVTPHDIFKKVYDANMFIESTVDKKSKISLRYREISHTPEEEESKEIVFYPLENIAARQGVKFKIPDRAYDPLAAFFNLLDSEYIVEKTLVFDSLSKEEVYEFKATPVENKNNIYKLKGEVFRKDKSSKHGASFTMWVRGGDVRIPLLVEVMSAAGPIYLRLREVE